MNETFNYQIELQSNRMNPIEMHLNRQRAYKCNLALLDSRCCFQLWFIILIIIAGDILSFLSRSSGFNKQTIRSECNADWGRHKLIVLIPKKFELIAARRPLFLQFDCPILHMASIDVWVWVVKQ